MATRKTVRMRSAGITVDVDFIGFDDAQDAFKQVRRNLSRELDELAQRAAEAEVLPDAKHRASHLKVAGQDVSASLVVRKRRSSPYLTAKLRGKNARAAGLQEFGGVVTTPILPKRAKALAPAAGGGHPVAAVRSARHYRAIRFMQDAAESQLDDFGRRLRDDIAGVFGRHMEVR